MKKGIIIKMTQGTFKLTIDKKITEQQLVENCISYLVAGYDYKLLFFFYALGKRMHKDDLTYYINLFDEIRDSGGKGENDK